jgi:hypothetical protein
MNVYSGNLFYGKVRSIGGGNEWVFFVPGSDDSKTEWHEWVVDLNKESPTFGARASAGDIVKVVNHARLRLETEVKITRIKIFCGRAIIRAIPCAEEGAGEESFEFSDLQLPRIFK